MLYKIALLILIVYLSVWAIDEIDPLGEYTPNYFAELLDVEIYNNDVAYIVGVGGFIFIDIRSINKPKFISRYNPGSIYIRFYNGVARENLAAGAARLDGLYFIDINEISNPKLLSIYKNNTVESFSYESVDFAGTIAYAAAHERGLELIDITNLSSPKSIKFINGLTNVWDVFLEGDLLYVADTDGGLKIFSLEDAENPILIGSAATNGAAFEVTVSNGKAYLALGANGFDIIDVSDPRNPRMLSNYTVGFGILQHLDVENDVVFASTWELVIAVDVSDPANPHLMATEETEDRAMGIAAIQNKIIVADWFTLRTYAFEDAQQPDIFVKPGVYDFGYQGKGVLIKHDFEVFNLGETDLDITDIQLSHEAFSSKDSQLTVPPGEEGKVTVTFIPTYDTYYGDALTFISNDDDEPEYTVKLIGGENGVEAGDEAHDFSLPALFDEKQYTLSEFRGRVVVMAIFASW